MLDLDQKIVIINETEVGKNRQQFRSDLPSVETNDKLDMAEARFFALIFFSFRITRTSVNTDVFGLGSLRVGRHVTQRPVEILKLVIEVWAFLW